MLISSSNRWALMHENNDNDELRLNDLLSILDNIDSDIVIVEGFKAEKFHKIELYREDIGKGKGLLYNDDDSIIAVATDADIKIKDNLVALDINNYKEIANFIINYLDVDK